MSLRRIISRSRLIVLGLNSGTSADGLDLVAVRIGGDKERPRLINGHSRRFPKRLQTMILQAADSPSMELEQLVRLDNYLGKYIGEAAAEFMTTLASGGITVDLIGSHGQTIRHVPTAVRLGGYAVRGTLQVGSLDQMAAATGCVTVGDFRQADVASGGEGAPITTGAMHRLLAVPGESRLIINIGGMANYFYFPSGRSNRDIAARDCGPGNSLSDSLMRQLYGRTFDRDGRIARRGKIHGELLTQSVKRLGFARRTKSTGRELFGSRLAEEMIRRGRRWKLAPEDLMATAAELTVLGIVKAVRPLLAADRRIRSMYLMGGGRRNRFFCERLGVHLPGCVIRWVDDLGIDGDLVEAAAYAVMAAACVRSTPLPVTRPLGGARAVLGRIAQPPLE